MQRDERERPSKAERIELVLRMQRPEKTSRTSSEPPSMDREVRREQSRPGGVRPGHEGPRQALSGAVAETLSYFPDQCPCCRMILSRDLSSEQVSVQERIGQRLHAIDPYLKTFQAISPLEHYPRGGGLFPGTVWERQTWFF